MNEDYKHKILKEQVALAMQQIPTMQGSSLIVAFALSYEARNIVPHVNIIMWVLMVLLIAVVRGVHYLRFCKISEGQFAGRYWRNIYLILALISGTVWGISAFAIPVGNPWLIVLFTLVIAGLSAGTTISHTSIRFGTIAWMGPALLAYAIRCCMIGGEFGYTLCFLIVLYLVTLLSFSAKSYRFIASAIASRFENLELIEKVQSVNDRLYREIAERKLAQETLRESEEKFRLAFRTSPDSMNLNRLSDGMYLDISDSFTKIMGYTPDDVIGKSSVELNIWQDAEDRERLVAGLKSAGFVENLEAKFLGRNGRIITGLMSACVLRIKQEDVILSITRDINDLKKAEEALRDSELRLRTILQTVNEGFVLVDNDTVAMDLNPRMCAILGRNQEEVLGRNFFDFVKDESKAILEHQIRLRAQGEAGAYEIALFLPDGSDVFCLFHATPLFDGLGNKVGSFAMVTDISNAKRLRWPCRKARRCIARLSACHPTPSLWSIPMARSPSAHLRQDKCSEMRLMTRFMDAIC